MNLPTNRVQGVPVMGSIVFWFVVVTLLGIWPALTNGQPFFFPDTPSYVRGADVAISKTLGSWFATDWARGWERDQRSIIMSQTSVSAPEPPEAGQKSARRFASSSRSIIYGALLYFGEVLGGMWLSIIIQSLIAAYLISIFIVRTLGLDFRYFLISHAILLIASPLPFFVSFLMPDVFAGFLILAFAILATSWDRLSHVERAIISVVLLFAVLSHITHLGLLLCLTAMTVGYVAVLNDRSQWINIRWLIGVSAACVVIAILWQVLFSFAASRVLGYPPIRLPNVTAKLVSMLGKPAVSKVCRSHAFVVCRFQDRLPVDIDTFVLSGDERIGIFSVADVQTKRFLSDEQLRFALAIVPPNLMQVVAGVCVDALRQLTYIGLSEYSYSPYRVDSFRDRLPSHYFDRISSTLAARSDGYVVFGQILYVITIIGVIFTALLLGGVLRPRLAHSANEIGQRRVWCAATYIQLAGIMVNAIICGGFSALHDRYQARVVWLILLSLITGISVMEPHRRIALFWKWKTSSDRMKAEVLRWP